MKILQENSIEVSKEPLSHRNIHNIFDINVIQRELEVDYGIETTVSPKRQWSSDIWYVLITAPYIGRCKDLVNPLKGTVVALFVDYENNKAFAMPRSGSDKTTMMLIASLANKHIQAPFQCDNSLRNRLHR